MHVDTRAENDHAVTPRDFARDQELGCRFRCGRWRAWRSATKESKRKSMYERITRKREAAEAEKKRI